jgi:hypothetical protein
VDVAGGGGQSIRMAYATFADPPRQRPHIDAYTSAMAFSSGGKGRRRALVTLARHSDHR